MNRTVKLLDYNSEELKFNIISKENGQDALAFFESEVNAKREIVGVIFDLTIPDGMDGKETIKEIRKTNLVIPAFVTSGYANDFVMINPREHGFTASICKPIRLSKLSDLLNNHMQTTT